jgi:hypothetical protein
VIILLSRTFDSMVTVGLQGKMVSNDGMLSSGYEIFGVNINCSIHLSSLFFRKSLLQLFY